MGSEAEETKLTEGFLYNELKKSLLLLPVTFLIHQ